MNVYELDTETLRMVYEDVSDANRTAYSAGFLQSYNVAYAELQRDVYKPIGYEEVAVENNRFAVSDLSYDCRSVIRLGQYQDFSEEAGYIISPEIKFTSQHGYIYIDRWYTGDSVWVEYLKKYKPLKNDTPTIEPEEATETNTPQIPEEAHRLLCRMAAADFFQMRRKPDLAAAQMWNYEREKKGLHRDMPEERGMNPRNLFWNFNGWR